MSLSGTAADVALGVHFDLRHVAELTNLIHQAFIRWGTGTLAQAGLEGVEVLGQFPSGAPSRSYLVLFPYRVGPDPKLLDNGAGFSLMDLGPKATTKKSPWATPARKGSPGVGPDFEAGDQEWRDQVMEENAPDDPRATVVPGAWLELGKALGAALPLVMPLERRPGGMVLSTINQLPTSLRGWYEGAGTGWKGVQGDRESARLPSLWWKPGVVLTVRYIAVAHDLGRGVTGETSAGPPLALPSLSVLATAMQVQRVIRFRYANLPAPPSLDPYVRAVVAGLRERVANEKTTEERTRALNGAADRLEKALGDLAQDVEYEVAILPVHDLNNHEFALLMQALQQRLQAALNVQIRLTVGAGVGFAPSLSARLFDTPVLR